MSMKNFGNGLKIMRMSNWNERSDMQLSSHVSVYFEPRLKMPPSWID